MGGQRKVDACTARGKPECTVKITSRQLGRGKLSEDVGLCVGKRNFLRRQLSGFVPLQPPYNATRDEDHRCHCRKGPTCDPLRTCGARLRSRGASLGCLDLSDLRFLAL